MFPLGTPTAHWNHIRVDFKVLSKYVRNGKTFFFFRIMTKYKLRMKKNWIKLLERRKNDNLIPLSNYDNLEVTKSMDFDLYKPI